MGGCASSHINAPKERQFRRAIKLYEVSEVKSMTNLMNRNRCFETGELPLTLAAEEGHEAIVQVLIKAGADVNLSDGNGRCPLHLAVHVDDVESVDLLLGAKANPNRYDSTGMTPLQLAALRGKAHLVKKLLDAGARPNEKEKSQCALLNALSNEQVECVEMLLKGGADPDSLDARGNSALHMAVTNGDEGSIRSLLKHGADINAVNKYTENILSLAAVTGKRKILNILLEQDSNININPEDDLPPMLGAAIKGHGECLDLLLAYGADVNILDKKGHSTLFNICMAICDVEKGMFYSHYFSNMYRNYAKHDPTDVMAENLTKCAMMLVQMGGDLAEIWQRFTTIFPSERGVSFEQMVLCEVLIQSYGFAEVPSNMLHNFSQQLLSIREYGLSKLFFSAGINPVPEDLYLLSTRSDEADRVMFKWAKRLKYHPRQLKDLCRRRIRHSLSWNVLFLTDKLLTIPDDLKEYICIMSTENYSQVDNMT